MRNDQLKPGYNAQIDTENQFILGCSVHQRLIDMIKHEPCLVDMKSNRGFKGFLLRGLPKVSLELGWLSLVGVFQSLLTLGTPSIYFYSSSQPIRFRLCAAYDLLLIIRQRADAMFRNNLTSNRRCVDLAAASAVMHRRRAGPANGTAPRLLALSPVLFAFSLRSPFVRLSFAWYSLSLSQ